MRTQEGFDFGFDFDGIAPGERKYHAHQLKAPALVQFVDGHPRDQIGRQSVRPH